MHNTLYKLEKNQKRCLLVLGILFLVLSMLWFIAELFEWGFPMEPLVVFVGGAATLSATYWPWRATNRLSSQRGRISFEYSTNRGCFDIGSGDRTFTLEFSKADDVAIHMYNYPESIKAIALVKGCGRIEDVKDASTLNYSSKSASPREGELVVLQNTNGYFAAILIHDIKDNRRGDVIDEVTFSYVIDHSKSGNFS